MDRFMEAGSDCLRNRARDYLRSKANVVEAMRRLGCTCENFHRLLVSFGKKGASLGSVKRHLAEMRRDGTFDEAEVLKLMDEHDSKERAIALFQREESSTPPANARGQAAGPSQGPAAVPPSKTLSVAVLTEQTGPAKFDWKPRTHLSYLRPS